MLTVVTNEQQRPAESRHFRASQIDAGPPATPVEPTVRFDHVLFELWANGTLVKRLDIRATNQIAILAAFQEEGWPPRIDDPLHPNGADGKSRLRSTIYCLNGCQRPPLVRFFADGSGMGIRWELLLVQSENKLRTRQWRRR